MRWRLLLWLIPLVSSGCQSPIPWVRAPQLQCYNRTLDDCMSCKVARDVARQHMHTLYKSEPGCWPSSDFQAGFEQAYADVAMGSDGQVPPVAPAAYWKSYHRTCEGHQKAQEWLSGYSTGASHAMECRGPYNRVMARGSEAPCPARNPSACGLSGVALAAGAVSTPQPSSVSQVSGQYTPITQRVR